MKVKLSNDARAILLGMYNLYLSRLALGETESSARFLGSSAELRRKLSSTLDQKGLDAELETLRNIGLVALQKGDDIWFICRISEQGISVCQNRLI